MSCLHIPVGSYPPHLISPLFVTHRFDGKKLEVLWNVNIDGKEEWCVCCSLFKDKGLAFVFDSSLTVPYHVGLASSFQGVVGMSNSVHWEAR